MGGAGAQECRESTTEVTVVREFAKNQMIEPEVVAIWLACCSAKMTSEYQMGFLGSGWLIKVVNYPVF